VFLPNGALVTTCSGLFALPLSKNYRFVLSIRHLRISRLDNSTIIADGEIVCNARPARGKMTRDDIEGSVAVVIYIRVRIVTIIPIVR
jgi:hypothetical protein